ncbi:MAG: histidine kinase [Chitinophagaceae bacterium]
MFFEKVVTYFLPDEVRSDKTHPKYHALRVVLSTTLIGLPLVLLFPVVLYAIGKPVLGFLINAALVIVIILSIKFLGHYRIPMTITAFVTYFIIYDWISDSGGIYSSNVSILHMYLLAAIWADKKYGWWAIFTNLLLFIFIYYKTPQEPALGTAAALLGSPLYALMLNLLITVFFGGFLAYLQVDQEKDRAKIRELQDRKISMLDEAVRQRTDQLNSIRENIARDFHDQTGNMLSAITRQASLLKTQLKDNDAARPVVDNIIQNSNALYSGSKDFLWHLNHHSDDPNELFDYLTSYGQHFYNQFDIAFSSLAEKCSRVQISPSAALNLLYIFKEAMTNVVKHSGATEVELKMICPPDFILYSLTDNGYWNEPDPSREHYGLSNIAKRCADNKFTFHLSHGQQETTLLIVVPLMPHKS